MKTSMLTTAIGLSDRDLLARTVALAGTEREATAELVAHLAALDLRPSLHAALGFGSLFHYCTQALRLSEDAACRRIEVARTCRRFPVLLDLLALGALSLTSVRMLSPHLTAENHEAVLVRARNRARKEIEVLVAELAPKPDVPASVRKLPAPRMIQAGAGIGLPDILAPSNAGPTSTDNASAEEAPSPMRAARSPTSATMPRPAVQASAPQRYRVQFTIGQATHDKLRGVQELLRRQIPNGDPGAIFDLALDALREKVEKARFGSPRREDGETQQDAGTYETRIRSSADRRAVVRSGVDRGAKASPSRYITKAVKRAVWGRDGGRCAFLATTGQRCLERNFLEFHHIQPHALDGPATIGNIALRCRRHNAYEAELVFGPREDSATVREVYQGGTVKGG